MKIPDKIYVHTGAHLGLLTLTTIPVSGPMEQEFIRKDALMEWLESILKCKPDNAGLFTEAAAIAFQQIIEKLNSM